MEVHGAWASKADNIVRSRCGLLQNESEKFAIMHPLYVNVTTEEKNSIFCAIIKCLTSLSLLPIDKKKRQDVFCFAECCVISVPYFESLTVTNFCSGCCLQLGP